MQQEIDTFIIIIYMSKSINRVNNFVLFAFVSCFFFSVFIQMVVSLNRSISFNFAIRFENRIIFRFCFTIVFRCVFVLFLLKFIDKNHVIVNFWPRKPKIKEKTMGSKNSKWKRVQQIRQNHLGLCRIKCTECELHVIRIVHRGWKSSLAFSFC